MNIAKHERLSRNLQVQNTTIYEPGSDIGWYNNASSVIRLEYEGA